MLSGYSDVGDFIVIAESLGWQFFLMSTTLSMERIGHQHLKNVTIINRLKDRSKNLIDVNVYII